MTWEGAWVDHDTAEWWNNRTRCIRCGECAAAQIEHGGDCTCEFGSCVECGVPYATAQEQTAQDCRKCREEAIAWMVENTEGEGR